MMKQRIERWGPWLSAGGVMIAFLLLVLMGIYSLRQQNYVDERLCQQTVDNREGLRLTWNTARQLILEMQETERGRQIINELFDNILKQIPPTVCNGKGPVEQPTLPG